MLKKAHPQFNWVGTVGQDEALSYIKGCTAIIISNQAHGVPNQGIEARAMDKQIISPASLEIPPKDQIDLNVAAKKYDDLIKSIMKV